MDMELETLKSLKIHETYVADHDAFLKVIRVPGGLVYRFPGSGVFVPFDPKEVKERKESLLTEEFGKAFVSNWNSKLKCGRTLTDDIKKKLEARLKSFSEDQIMVAANNRISFVANNKFFNTNVSRNDIMKVVGTDSSLDKYLNFYNKDLHEDVVPVIKDKMDKKLLE